MDAPSAGDEANKTAVAARAIKAHGDIMLGDTGGTGIKGSGDGDNDDRERDEGTAELDKNPTSYFKPNHHSRLTRFPQFPAFRFLRHIRLNFDTFS